MSETITFITEIDSLRFYVGDTSCDFVNGRYSTSDPEVIKTLKRLPRIQEVKVPIPSEDKIRVHDLAKELGKTSSEVLQALEDLGVKGKAHTSLLTVTGADKVRKALS